MVGIIVAQLVEFYATVAVAVWDAVAAEPKLQLMVAGLIGFVLVKGGVNALVRRVR